jgi:hypothetical protein
MERDPRQDRDRLHVGVDGEQFVAAALEHDPENRVPVFPRDVSGTRLRGDHAQIKAMKRDDDSGKSHSALELQSSSACFVFERNLSCVGFASGRRCLLSFCR